MPDPPKSGPETATKALIAVLALPVVLVLVFLLVGKVQSSQDASLSPLKDKGLQWAKARATSDGFTKLKSYDSLGRDRGQRDSQAWQVCFVSATVDGKTQPVTAKKYARSTLIELGAVRLEETCPPPGQDQGRIDPALEDMPNLKNRTAYMARVAFGDDASIRMVDVSNGEQITRNLGDYRICAQTPDLKEPWDGVPVKLGVIRYEHKCSDYPNAQATLDQLLP